MKFRKSALRQRACLGAASLEFLILIPVLLLLLIGGSDLARSTQAVVAVNDSVRIGLTTASLLFNQKDADYKPIYYERKANGDIEIDQSLINDVTDSVVMAAPSYLNDDDVSVLTPLCRCPDYDPTFSASGWVSCVGQSAIQNCSLYPQIKMEVSAETQISYSFSGYFGFPEFVTVSSTSEMVVR